MKRKITEIDLTDELLPLFLDITKNNKNISEKFLNSPLSCINDLINLADLIEDSGHQKIKILKNLKKPLQNLNDMIGLNSKEQIFEQILYYLFTDEKRDEMLHTVIHGRPGSERQNYYLIADIYKNLDILSDSHNISVSVVN